MSDALLDRCPADVMDANMTFDTLRVVVPYQSVKDNVVEVPPLVPDNAFSSWLQGTAEGTSHAALSTAAGRKPQGEQQFLIGWQSSLEESERERLAEKAEAMLSMRAGLLHPDVRDYVTQLSQSALADLATVKGLYDLWANSKVAVKFSASPFSAYQIYDGVIPLDLEREWPDIAATMVDADPVDFFQTFEKLLQGERGGWPVCTVSPCADPTMGNFHAAMVAARERDRQEIRARLRAAYRKIWCAEYGVAQSESYYANKEQYERGPGKFDPSGSIVPRPRKLILKGKQITQDADFVPPEVPEETPSTTKWYQTTAAKVAFVVGGLAVAGAASYGVYTYTMSRRRAA